MKELLRVGVAFAAALVSTACSSCSDNGDAADAGVDAGSDSDTDTDADMDTDADTDTDTDSDTDSDTDTGTEEGFVPDAGPWNWEDLPDAGDCGVDGCEQLSFGVSIVNLGYWDVRDGLMAYVDNDSQNTIVVNYTEHKQLIVPNPYPAFPLGGMFNAGNFYPAVYNDSVCYSKLAGNSEGTEMFSDLICANLQYETQKEIYNIQWTGGTETPNPAKSTDLYGTRIVSQGGCGTEGAWPLCVFNINAPGTDTELVSDSDGANNTSLWGDVVVWATSETDNYNIRAYNFTTSTFTDITNDTAHQEWPRIYSDKVVYMDLKLGDSTLMGDWNHAAIFM